MTLPRLRDACPQAGGMERDARDDAALDGPHAAGGAALPGHPPGVQGMPGPFGPAVTTEAVGDPDASSRQSAAEGGAAAGVVLGAVVAGPIGLAAGAALGSAAGAAAGPEEAPARPGDGRVDPRTEREAAFTPHDDPAAARPPATRDPLIEEHAVDVPVVDALSGHGDDAVSAKTPAGVDPGGTLVRRSDQAPSRRG
jgi:hypothetical protein